MTTTIRAGSGSGTGVIVGVILEIMVALAGIGTAVALGLVGSRVLEAATIFAGAAILMTMVTCGRTAPAQTRWPCTTGRS
jgi:hypothetical protein